MIKGSWQSTDSSRFVVSFERNRFRLRFPAHSDPGASAIVEKTTGLQYTHTYTRTHVHTYTRTHVHTYTRTHVHTCTRTFFLHILPFRSLRWSQFQTLGLVKRFWGMAKHSVSRARGNMI